MKYIFPLWISLTLLWGGWAMEHHHYGLAYIAFVTIVLKVGYSIAHWND